jgi:hypothetical protein
MSITAIRIADYKSSTTFRLMLLLLRHLTNLATSIFPTNDRQAYMNIRLNKNGQALGDNYLILEGNSFYPLGGNATADELRGQGMIMRLTKAKARAYKCISPNIVNLSINLSYPSPHLLQTVFRFNNPLIQINGII